MKKRLVAMLLAVMLLVMAIPVVAGADSVGYIVKVKNYANVRKSPKESSSLLGCVKLGAEVTVKGESGEYTKITCTNTRGKKVTGYVYTKFVSDKPPVVGYVTIKSESCKVYAKKSTSSTVLGTVTEGTKLPYNEKPSTWYKVTYNDQTGYIRKADAAKTGKDVSATGYGYVTSRANVRKGASTAFESLGKAQQYQVFEIIAKNGDWFKIKWIGGKEVYIHKSLFKKVTSEAVEPKEAEVVDCKTCNVRISPSGRKIDTAKAGDTVWKIGESGSYFLVVRKGKLGDGGKVGYIHEGFIKFK